MAAVLADTHVLLWLLKDTLAGRSQVAAEAIDRALTAETIHVSIGPPATPTRRSSSWPKRASPSPSATPRAVMLDLQLPGASM